jgi:sugar phosphate isomerase/epimerase
MKRRHFMNVSTMAASTLLLNPLEALATPSGTRPQPGFALLIFATNWGYTGTWDEFCSRIKKLGYDGTELWFPMDDQQRTGVLATLKQYDLKYGFLIGSGDPDPEKNFAEFSAQLEGAVKHKPVYINCHSGKDYFGFEQNRKFIDLTIRLSRETKIPVYHETHRSRILYAAPVARDFMQQLQALEITLDASHWCNVHESLLDDQEETMSLALERTGHIHARIGHPEGPQVNDPRAPEWKAAVEKHFSWWDKVVERHKRAGKVMTILTEFGPPDYLPALPFTRQPLADQWDINVHMMKTLRTRYT